MRRTAAQPRKERERGEAATQRSSVARERRDSKAARTREERPRESNTTAPQKERREERFIGEEEPERDWRGEI